MAEPVAAQLLSDVQATKLIQGAELPRPTGDERRPPLDDEEDEPLEDVDGDAEDGAQLDDIIG